MGEDKPYPRLTYYSCNAYTFAWADGRRLATATKGSTNFSFTYNDEGIRTSKTVGSVKHTYILDGTRIVSEQWGIRFVAYLYDESGTPIGMQYRTSSMAEDVFETHYFEKNLQGDIIAVYNASGLKVAGYTYDAWGNCTTTYYNGGGSTGAQYNPFRYRGYYYDSDLGLYYLNNRYYDSKTGRFINSDSVLNGGVGLTSYNSFAYCSNNPIKYSDPSGYFAKDHKMTTLAPGTPWADDRIYLTGNNTSHWENYFFNTSNPDFFKITKEGFVLINWGFNIYKGVFYFDSSEDHSLYISIGNINAYTGLNYKEGIGANYGASVLEAGYDGRFVDANVEFLTVGAKCIYFSDEDGTGPSFGYFDGSISIDVMEIYLFLMEE